MSDENISGQIYLSRDQIRTQMADYMKSYLELENVDLTKSSFLSFLVNVVSTLTSNLLFYETGMYREFFLTQAKMPDSVLNLAAFLGYNSKEASYSTVDVLMTFPFKFTDPTVTFQIPENFKFLAKDIQFLTYTTTTVVVTDNSTVVATAVYQNKSYNLPVNIDSTSSEFSILIPARQYNITNQEFQISGDLEAYQFPELQISVSGQLSSMTIEVIPPGSSSPTTYTEYESLYLMGPSDYGYTSRKTQTGRKIYFGNGLIGIQPDPSSTVLITTYETLGVDGNVISGSVISGDRIYTTSMSGQVKIVDYTCINADPASGGEDEESTDEIRSNSIANLVSMKRLVTQTDFENVNVVIPDSPFGQNSLPVLKRSDVKCNEIQLYTTLVYNDEIALTRNAVYDTSTLEDFLPKLSVININGTDFYTIFDMFMDYTNNSAFYNYVITSVTIVPSLNTSYNSIYNLIDITNLIVEDISGTAVFELEYTGTDSSAICVMEILENGSLYNMTNDTVNKRFYLSVNPYTLLPEDNLSLYFTISSPDYGSIAKYSAKVVFRQSLDKIMMSNLVNDSTSVTVYDIPVIQKTYYDAIVDKQNFELQCLQSFMMSSDFENYRMLTDFINLKFTNTTGVMQNMKKNRVNRLPVLDIINTPPITPALNDRYIIGANPTGVFSNYKNYYAQCTNAITPTWHFSLALTDDIVLVTNLANKYIFTGSEWIIPEFSIPLQISIEVFKSDTYFSSEVELINAVKEALITQFSSRFGINAFLYRSEIISCIQGVTGVQHCNLLTPKCNIFFNFEMSDLTREELLSYGPEYVFFTEDSISIVII